MEVYIRTVRKKINVYEENLNIIDLMLYLKNLEKNSKSTPQNKIIQMSRCYQKKNQEKNIKQIKPNKA